MNENEDNVFGLIKRGRVSQHQPSPPEQKKNGRGIVRSIGIVIAIAAASAGVLLSANNRVQQELEVKLIGEQACLAKDLNEKVAFCLGAYYSDGREMSLPESSSAHILRALEDRGDYQKGKLYQCQYLSLKDKQENKFGDFKLVPDGVCSQK
jgi:hypothetical protein